MISPLIDAPADDLTYFYYVVRAKGISRAPEYMQKARRLLHPPDVSTFSRIVASLEEQVGARLIERDPFRLLPRGEEIFETARLQVETISARWTEQVAPHGPARPTVRCAAADFACREQLPLVIAEAERQLGIQLEIHPATELQILRGLERRDYDVAVTSLNDFDLRGAQTFPLARFDLVLVVSKDAAPAYADEVLVPAPAVTAAAPAARGSRPPLERRPVKAAKHFLSQRVVRELLVCADSTHGLVRVFDRDLERMGVQWPHRYPVMHTALVANIVAHIPRVGLSLDIPGLGHARAHTLRLPGFTEVIFGAVCLEPANKYVRPIIEIMREVAMQFRYREPGPKE